MCGIVGVIAKGSSGLSKQEFDIFDELLYHDVVRGPDATGVITVDRDGGFHIDKDAVPAYEFAKDYTESRSYKSRVQNAVALIGHNRKATSGLKDKAAGAHPFVAEDRFAMVHNGTLYVHKDLADVDIDSHALTIALDRRINATGTTETTKEAVQEVLSDVYGAYACVWYNQMNNTIGIVRNNERPLYIIEGPWAYFFASELGMLWWVLGRNNLKAEKEKACSVEVDCLYTFELDVPRSAMKKEGLTVKKYTAPTNTTTTTTGSGPVSTHQFGKTSTDVSKNLFKRMRSYWLGKTIGITIDNYMPKHFPVGNGVDFLIEGKCPKMTDSAKHVVRGEVNLNDLEVMAVNNLVHGSFEGFVSDVLYDKAAREVTFQVKEIKRSFAT